TGSTENTQWVYSGNGHEYDKNPVLRKFESVAVNNNIISASLEPISLTIVQLGVSPGTGAVPSIPGPPQITVIPGLGAANDISFEAAADANFYELQRSISDGAFETLVFLDSLELTYVETPVNSSEIYNYRVRAGNAFGYSDYSPVTVVQPDMEPSSTGFRLFNSQGTDVVLDGANDMISKQSNDVNAPSQEWAIQFVGEDAFKIQNLANDQFLAATSGEAVTLSADNSSDDLLWEIELISGSTYFIKSVFNGNYLAGTGQNPGTAIRTEPFLGWLRQEWTFTSTDGSDDDDSILNSIFNGGFEIGELTGDPSNWVRSTNFSDAFMQTRQGTWSPFGLTPNGNRAYGLRIRVSHPGEPFITELFKPVDGDLIMRNGFLHEVAFLAKSSAAASIGVRATWIKEDGTLGDVLADTVVVTSASDPTNWTTFSIPLLIEEQLESTGNVFLQFGFADNPVDTYIMIDDVVVNTLLAPPGNLQSSNVTRSSFDLSWNGVINGVPIAEASIYIDDSVVAVTSGNSTTLTGLTSEAPYRVRVKGEDANGNISPFSSPLFVTIPDSTVLPLLNGDFEIGGPTAPPSHWSQEMGDASAQARSGEWMSLPPHNDQAYGVSITIQNENPYNTRLYKPESGDLYLESGIPYKIEFLAKSGTSAAISVRAQWMSGSNPVLLDTVYQTIEGFPWTLFEGFLQVDEGEAGASANLMLEFGFADNPSGTNIMVDDIEIINLTSLPYIPLEIEEATILNIEEVDVSKYMMYPNPLVSGLLTLRMKSGQRSSRVIISDTMGKIILDKQCKEDSLELSRENFRSGMYLVKIITERERKIIKLMVE
ncbi:MAG: T9SS type A sorting domain-containing protein, partial [Bacteroidota bacterium]